MHQSHAIQAIEWVIVELKHKYATMIPVITTVFDSTFPLAKLRFQFQVRLLI